MVSLLIRQNDGKRGPSVAALFGGMMRKGGHSDPPHLANSGKKGAKRSLLIRRNAGTRGPSVASLSGGMREQGGHGKPPHSAKCRNKGAKRSLLIRRNRGKGGRRPHEPRPHEPPTKKPPAAWRSGAFVFLNSCAESAPEAHPPCFNYISMSTTFSTAFRRSSLTRRSVIFSSSSYIWMSLSWAMKSSLDRTRS